MINLGIYLVALWPSKKTFNFLGWNRIAMYCKNKGNISISKLNCRNLSLKIQKLKKSMCLYFIHKISDSCLYKLTKVHHKIINGCTIPSQLPPLTCPKYQLAQSQRNSVIFLYHDDIHWCCKNKLSQDFFTEE